MSPRHRRQPQSSLPPIPWLEHREGFPTEAERQALIRRREALQDELLPLLLDGLEPDDPPARRLVRKYGWEEVERAVDVLEEARELPSFVADEATFFRLYRHRFARFGGQRPFYQGQELEAIQEEHLGYYLERIKSDPHAKMNPREKEIEDLLLAGWRTWEDITPPAAPPRPAGFRSPAPASYREPLASILAWGTDLDWKRIEGEAGHAERWSRRAHELERMALDPGLLDGWPGEAQSWAPWHALQLLGALGAWQSIPALARLSGCPNDWLSDLLPDVWARMGMEAEPVLWMVLEDTASPPARRGLAAEALTLLVEQEPLLSGKMARGFGQLLQKTLPGDPALNAYLIHFTRELGELDRIRPIARAAFEEQRVDLKIITPEDLEEEQA